MTEPNASQANDQKLPPSKESFVRWQKITIDQFGYAVNLILSFATATLGFSLVIVKDLPTSTGCVKYAFSLSLFSVLVSIALGIFCVINRLRDFRKTKDIARDRNNWNRDGKAREEIDTALRFREEETERLGRRTWKVFYWQIGFFGLGVVLFMVGFAIVYGANLF